MGTTNEKGRIKIITNIKILNPTKLELYGVLDYQ